MARVLILFALWNVSLGLQLIPRLTSFIGGKAQGFTATPNGDLFIPECRAFEPEMISGLKESDTFKKILVLKVNTLIPNSDHIEKLEALKPEALVFYLADVNKDYDRLFSDLKSDKLAIFFTKPNEKSREIFESNCGEIDPDESKQIKVKKSHTSFLKLPHFEEFSCSFSSLANPKVVIFSSVDDLWTTTASLSEQASFKPNHLYALQQAYLFGRYFHEENHSELMLSLFNRAHRFQINSTSTALFEDPEFLQRQANEMISDFLQVEMPEILIFTASLDSSSTLRVVACAKVKVNIENFLSLLQHVTESEGLTFVLDRQSCENTIEKNVIVLTSAHQSSNLSDSNVMAKVKVLSIVLYSLLKGIPYEKNHFAEFWNELIVQSSYVQKLEKKNARLSGVSLTVDAPLYQDLKSTFNQFCPTLSTKKHKNKDFSFTVEEVIETHVFGSSPKFLDFGVFLAALAWIGVVYLLFMSVSFSTETIQQRKKAN